MEPGTTLLMRVGLNSYMFVFQPGTGQTQTVEWGLFLQARNSICLRHPLATIAVPTFQNFFKARSIMSSIVLDDRKAHFQIRTAKPTKPSLFLIRYQAADGKHVYFQTTLPAALGNLEARRACGLSKFPCRPVHLCPQEERNSPYRSAKFPFMFRKHI